MLRFSLFFMLALTLINAIIKIGFGYFFTNIILTLHTGLIEENLEINQVIIQLLIIVVCMFLFKVLEVFFFKYASLNLIHDVRSKLFVATVHKHMSWFDKKARS